VTVPHKGLNMNSLLKGIVEKRVRFLGEITKKSAYKSVVKK